ncbi:MAG: BrnT family toxin [Fibrobacteria bacterium]
MMDSFEWDDVKNEVNQEKHGISFEAAQLAFLDPKRIIALDKAHSTTDEKRFYCMGKVNGGILTVRFTYRSNTIRIIGAGHWRKGKRTYEKEI